VVIPEAALSALVSVREGTFYFAFKFERGAYLDWDDTVVITLRYGEARYDGWMDERTGWMDGWMGWKVSKGRIILVNTFEQI